MYDDEHLLALSGLQHLSFCERQWALIHVEQIWTESADTLRGQFFHERVNTAGYSCSRGYRASRCVRLVSRELGIYGIADIVETDLVNGHVRPVEYKVGKPKQESWDRLQLAAQAMCLEEMLSLSVDEGYLFYGVTKRRELVSVDSELRNEVTVLAHRAYELYESGLTPVMDMRPACHRCSLFNDCMPAAGQRDVYGYWHSFGVELGEK